MGIQLFWLALFGANAYTLYREPNVFSFIALAICFYELTKIHFNGV